MNKRDKLFQMICALLCLNSITCRMNPVFQKSWEMFPTYKKIIVFNYPLLRNLTNPSVVSSLTPVHYILKKLSWTVSETRSKKEKCWERGIIFYLFFATFFRRTQIWTAGTLVKHSSRMRSVNFLSKVTMNFSGVFGTDATMMHCDSPKLLTCPLMEPSRIFDSPKIRSTAASQRQSSAPAAFQCKTGIWFPHCLI